MQKFVNKFMKAYDFILNCVFVILLLFTAFVICYYALPSQTSEIIAKALSFTDNAELASKLMNYISGFTIGAGFPLWFSQKAMISRYLNNASNKQGLKTTQEILADNLDLTEIQIEFQKAEAYRFMNSPTMPAKAKLYYKSFLSKLESLQGKVATLKEEAVPVKKKEKKKKAVVKEIVKEESDKLDGLI